MAKAQLHPHIGKARVFLVDDETFVRTALRISIGHQPDLTVVGEAADEWGALAGIQRLRPDVVITDLYLQDGDGVALIRQLRRMEPELRVLAFTSHDSSLDVARAIGAGAHGFVLKEDGTHKLIEALASLLHGETSFSEKVRKYVTGINQSPPGAPSNSLGAT